MLYFYLMLDMYIHQKRYVKSWYPYCWSRLLHRWKTGA